MDDVFAFFRNARTRFVVVSFVLTISFTAAVLVIVYVNAHTTISGEIRSVVAAELAGIDDDYERSGLSGLIAGIDRRLITADERDAIYLLTDENGDRVAGNVLEWPADVTPGEGWVEVSIRHPETGAVVPIAADSMRLGRGKRFLVGRYTTEARKFDRVLAQSLGLALIAAVALSLMTSWLLTNLVFSRISAITKTATEIMSGDLSLRIPLRGSDDEIERMIITLNEMLNRIEALVENLRATTNSIGHDLRSPLARLRQRIDMLADPDRPISDRESDALRATAEVDHILKVFSRLTEISRAEAGMGRDVFKTVEINSLVEDVVELYQPLASDHHIELVLTGRAPAIQGSSTLIAQALSNLLENALRYAPPGSQILIELSEGENHVGLSVRDAGPGIPEESLESVLQPFVTLDPSRTEQKSGLGLTLVSAVARLHEGTFVLRGGSPGLIATLRIPTAIQA